MCVCVRISGLIREHYASDSLTRPIGLDGANKEEEEEGLEELLDSLWSRRFILNKGAADMVPAE